MVSTRVNINGGKAISHEPDLGDFVEMTSKGKAITGCHQIGLRPPSLL